MVLLPVEFISYDHPYTRQNLYRHQCHRPNFCNGDMKSNIIPIVFPVLDIFGNSLLQRMATYGWNRHPERWIHKMDVTGFQPDDIKVSVHDQTIVVHALHMEGEGDNIDSHETKRAFKIPENVNKEKLSSYMKNGVLIIEAPYIETPIDENEKPTAEKQTEEKEATEKELDSRKEKATEEKSQQKESNETSKAEEDGENKKSKHYQMNISLPSFHPDNITVTSDNGSVSIRAKNEYNSHGIKMSESFLRSFKLPDNVDTEGLKCTRDNDGQLHITAPYRCEPYHDVQPLCITKEEHPMLK